MKFANPISPEQNVKGTTVRDQIFRYKYFIVRTSSHFLLGEMGLSPLPNFLKGGHALQDLHFQRWVPWKEGVTNLQVGLQFLHKKEIKI